MLATAALACLALYILFFQATWGPMVWVMLGEIFPLSVRGAGTGFAIFLLWSANFLVALTFPPLLSALGVGWLFGIFALICLGAALFTWFLVPETKGRSLEQIQADLGAKSKRGRRRVGGHSTA